MKRGCIITPHWQNEIRRFGSTQGEKIQNRSMATIFPHNVWVVHVEFIPKESTINSYSYCLTLKRLRIVIKNERRGMLTSGGVLLHDNVIPHSTKQKQDLLKSFKWDIINHPSYSADLSPYDYHLFGPMKQHLEGEKYGNDAEVEAAIRDYLSEVGREFYWNRIFKLVSHVNNASICFAIT